MFQNAYARFFLSVLLGSAFALWPLFRAHAHEVIATLRGNAQRIIDLVERVLEPGELGQHCDVRASVSGDRPVHLPPSKKAAINREGGSMARKIARF